MNAAAGSRKALTSLCGLAVSLSHVATSSEKLAKAVAANAIDSATAKSPPAPSTAAIIRRLKDTVVLLLTAVTAAATAAGLSAKSDEEAGGRSGDGGSMRYFNLVKYDYAEVVERRCIFVICGIWI